MEKPFNNWYRPCLLWVDRPIWQPANSCHTECLTNQNLQRQAWYTWLDIHTLLYSVLNILHLVEFSYLVRHRKCLQCLVSQPCKRDPCQLQTSQHFNYFFLGFKDHTFGERFLLRTLTWAKNCTGNIHISPSSYSNLINLNTPKSTDCDNSGLVKELQYKWT